MLLLLHMLNLVMQSIALAAGASAAATLSAPSFVFAGDPDYGAPISQLSEIMICPQVVSSSSGSPVLLIHGTGSRGDESFGKGYVPALQQEGYSPCYLNLPDRSMGDMQETAAFIAYNLHYLSYLAGGRKVAVLGHSQGNPDIFWATRFWKSTREVVSMYIGLSPDLAGVQVTEPNQCTATVALSGNTTSACQPSQWQQKYRSNFMNAMRYNFTEQVPTTLIWSQSDEVVHPAEENAQLPHSVSFSVQDLCESRLTDHFSMLIDAAGFAFVLDALAHGGHASLSRVQASNMNVCSMLNPPSMDAMIPSLVSGIVKDEVLGITLTGPFVAGEPPIKPYAQEPNQS